MRILQILPELKVGGVETGTIDFAKYLLKHNHHSVVVSNGGALVQELEEEGIKHYELPVHKKNFFIMLRSIKTLEKIIKEERVDIVHARSRVPAWIAYFACRRAKAAFITTCHGYYGAHIFSKVMSWGKLTIVPSEVIGRHMIEDFGMPAEDIRCIPRSVDVQKFDGPRDTHRPKSQFVVSMIGRITPLKGHSFFLKAMAKVIRTMPYVKIWIIGDVPSEKESYRDELQVLVRRLGLADYVEFLGSRRDIPQLLASIDCLVLSTITEEAFGRVILEAQAAGVPVVATQVGGVVEIIDDGTTGLLVLPKDTDAMANAVMRILKDKKLAESLVAAARKKIQEKFTLEHMASQTIKAYEELLKILNILVIKIGSIGDVVLVSASLKALRQKFPHAKICCLVGEESREILRRCPYVDELIVIDSDKNWFGLLKFARRLRKYKFDKIIDFQNNRKSHLLSFLSFSLESYGYNNKKWGFLLTDGLKLSSLPIPPVEHQFEILKMLGIAIPKDLRLEMWPASEDERYAQELLDAEWLGNSGNIVGINIAASEKWPTKNWPITHMAKLCDILAEKNIRTLITGTEKDKDAVHELLSLTKSKPAIMVAKTDISQLSCLIKRCKVFVTPDSAPMHIAAAMGTSLVSLFGPTDPLRHLPPTDKLAVIKKDLQCSPCYSSRCKILSHACMMTISPEEVAEKIEHLMMVNKAK